MQRPKRSNGFRYQRDDASARDRPDVDTDAAQWRLGKGQDPFRVIWDPALGQPEHSLLGVPRVDDEVDSLSAEPASFRNDAVERGTETLKVASYIDAISACQFQVDDDQYFLCHTYQLSRICLLPYRGLSSIVPILQSCPAPRRPPFLAVVAPLHFSASDSRQPVSLVALVIAYKGTMPEISSERIVCEANCRANRPDR